METSGADIDPDTPDEPLDGPRFVVGVGASAGGLEALEAMFHGMPPDTGAAFVVLQHLSPDFESHMDELLGRQTVLRVTRVVDGMALEPNTIYLNAPRKEMIVSGGRLILADRDPNGGLNLPIDHFFRSLAHDLGPEAVGVILSGTGSDGSRGIRDIDEAGGLVIAQSADTARFDGMPRAAQETGVVDLVLAPQEVPEALVRHFARERTPEVDKSDLASDPEINEAFRLLRTEHGLDFAHYKPNTVIRRIERRMQLTGVADWTEYVRTLRESPLELEALYKDLLIGVTRFFRDRPAFDFLERSVVPAIVGRATPESELRVWVPGCATGEEAYSLAMLFHEHLEQMGRPPSLKVFATDVHRTSLETAAIGCYGTEALEDVSVARRTKYFQPDGAMWRVSKELRQLVVFARHNVLNDAPFTRIDLISCRNMLIYLRPAAQKKVLSLFHFGLRTGGTLVLGPSETPGELADELEPLERRWKIYRKRRDVRLPTNTRLPLAPALPVRVRAPLAFPRPGGEGQLLAIYDRLLDRYMPAGLLVDERHDLVHAFGSAEQLLRFRSGRPSTNLLDLVHEALKPTLSGALAQVQKKGTPVSYTGVRVRTGDAEQVVRVSVEPFVDGRLSTKHYLITLSDPEPAPTRSASAEEVDPGEMSRDYIVQLEGELQFTKENLQATIEELETSNEELQAANEELVAANEELQSTNEELHSVNEELHTVNVEHQRKIQELTELTDDMDNLLHSTELGVLFLDKELAIRKFTPRMADLFHLLPQDVGRSFESFARNLDHPKLVELIQRVLRSGEHIEEEVGDRRGRSYLLRLLPYMSGAEQRGVLLTLIDIEHIKRAEANIRRLSAIVESTEDAVVGIEPDGRIGTWNRGAEHLYGYGSAEAIGQSISIVIPADRRQEIAEILERVREGKGLGSLETTRCTKEGREIHVSVTLSPVFDHAGRIIGGSDIARDITRQKQAEDRMIAAVKQRDDFLAMLSHELRNPLAALMMASRMLDDPDADDALKGSSNQVIVRQARHMARILDDLLDVTRMRQDRIEMRRERIDARACIERAIETTSSMQRARGISLRVNVPDAPVRLYADPARVQQVIINLLTNAFRHTPRGRSVFLELTVAHTRPPEAILSVRDEGDGIPVEIQERIFEPFFRTGNYGADTTGLGLGLALVKSIVEAHEGRVRARSDGAGAGAELEVRFPLDTSDEAPADTHPRRSHPDGVMRVVLIEDQDDSRQLLARLLGRRGYEVVTAATGDEGLAAILEHPPDVAIVDIGLPGLDGHEVARRVRDSDHARQTYLVALTGWGQQTDRARALAAGFDRHLVKPVDLDLLLEVLGGAKLVEAE